MANPNDMTSFYVQILFFVYVLIILKVLWLLFFCFRAFILPNFFPIDFKLKFGEWAVITGATDGIGKAYAIELAKRELNVVLISRTQTKLDQVAKEIQDNYQVKVKTIQVDFTQGQFIYEQITNQLKDIPVGILINNVGTFHKIPTYFLDVPDKDLLDIMTVNNGATVMMTKLILPGMIQRGKGAIVNISSITEIVPMPLITVYAASKAFVKSFSEALRFEYARNGVTIQTISPLFIVTNMTLFSSYLNKTNLLMLDPETFASSALKTLGRVNSTAGHWSHEIQYFIINLFPQSIVTFIAGTLGLIVRKEYLQRKLKVK